MNLTSLLSSETI